MSSALQEYVVIDLDKDGDIKYPDTPQTSVSPDRLSTPKTSAPSSTPFSPEALTFFKHLENYIPVGCLVYDIPHAQSVNPETPEWQECMALSELEGFPEYLFRDVQKLHMSGWVRLFYSRINAAQILRVYILPGDVGNRYVDHSSRILSKALHTLVRALDVSPQTWNGRCSQEAKESFDFRAALDEGSLYWMFNTLPSPAPSPERIKSHFHREALESLLNHQYQLPGLATKLYPYQTRSAGLMLQRECETRLELDPRLEQRVAPDGSMYFYSPRDAAFLRSPRFYETPKGGILAETMGLGKTLMCIALVLSTVGHLPKVPMQYETIRKRSQVGTLTEMAIASINKYSAPWKSFFSQHARRTGEHMTHCTRLLHQNAPTYEIPMEPIRWNRKTTTPPPKRLILASTTLIVVPRNLFSQWKSELQKHVKEDSLAILYMDDPKKNLPSPSDLILYDVILFSRPRFEQEDRDGSDKLGRRQVRYPVSCNCPYIGASLKRDCTCLREEDLYSSPLKHIHFLRIIIDEGHFFSSSKSIAAHVANEIVTADHRWVVSGTPAKDLLGVEMDTIASETATLPDQVQRQDALELRRHFSAKEDTSGATKGIGELVTHFLKVRPWAKSDDEISADWKSDIYRHDDPRTRMRITGFSRSLRRILESVVVKTRAEDVERDIELPPLEHHVVRLKPSFYDKLTVNTFILVLTANAVTSERIDADYLFHPNSQKERSLLVNNLRESAFIWTGFTADDILTSIKNSEGYLKKDGIVCTEEDRSLLLHCVEQAKQMLNTKGWTALGKSHEVGLFVEDWPEESAHFWSFDGYKPMLCGAKQLLEAQTHVNEQAGSQDPTEGLAGAGLRALAILRAPTTKEANKANEGHKPVKSGVPLSVMSGQPTFHKRSEKARSPRSEHKVSILPGMSPGSGAPTSPAESKRGKPQQLPLASPLRRTAILGTTSAKLSYLLSRIYVLSREEKILVFYDGDNTAYYIAQALEILHIHHLIYAKSLNNAQKSDYIVRFDKDPSFRVLLMDVRQAAYGLNVSSASRVFFINFCRPQIEAQAIKRAHRIGQTRRVVVETLLLEGTIEEEMYERARRMTRAEHSDAKMLDDDGGIKEIIQSARPLRIEEDERTGYGQVALLQQPQQLWSRPDWGTWKKRIDDEVSAAQKTGKRKAQSQAGNVKSAKKQKKAPAVTFVDITDASEPQRLVDALDDGPSSPITTHAAESPYIQDSSSAATTIPGPSRSITRLPFASNTAAGTSASAVPMNRVFGQIKARSSLFGGDGK